jgi:ribosomal protein S18 acetylase RimI-like enzyme
MKKGPRTFIENDPNRLNAHLSEIISLSNGEKEALGFLPQTAYEDAIAHKRLIAMLAENDSGECSLAGYILHGGIFPHARVQQICTSPSWRRRNVASALIDALVSDLERKGFLTVKAKVAADLGYAQSFYGRHGFEALTSKPGGAARGRTIVVRVRDLDTPHLFSQSASPRHISLPKRFGKDAPFYTFDLNVFFDLVKNRQRHASACALFAAALDHRIRLGVAPEFIEELRRTTTGQKNDPVLQMALQLPRLPPPVDPAVLTKLADDVHQIVFVERNVAGAGSTQARSDAKHLAHSALSRVSGFITSDGALLAARNELLEKVGVDVAGLDELISLLPEAIGQNVAQVQFGEGFECKAPTVGEATAHLKLCDVSDDIIKEVEGRADGRIAIWRLAVWENANIVALACLIRPESVESENRLLIHVAPGHLERELYAELLLDASIKEACTSGPAVIRLWNVAGQPTVTTLAKSCGFVATGDNRDLVKVAIGQPLTQSNWDALRHKARRRTGVSLPTQWPEVQGSAGSVTISTEVGESLALSPERFEDLFGPTLLLWANREAVIVPIQRAYADELLGTNLQTRLPFIANRDASFVSRRAYVNTPRARNVMRPGLPILFYESGKNGGRGAVIAAGRIVDSVLAPKARPSRDTMRRVVVDDLSDFSALDDVLMTTFDNLLLFPKPVRFATLKNLDAVGGRNLISATPVSHDKMVQIIAAGWKQ